MNQEIPAVFADGVFRPLIPVDLEEGTRVVVGVPHATLPAEGGSSQLAWKAYLAKMAALPVESPPDGLSNRDHDGLLYGD